MKSIIINVTKQDIQLGVKLSAHRCPIALAMKRKFKGVRPFVYFDSFRLYSDKKEEDGFPKQFREFGLPNEAMTFVERFDNSKLPLSYHLPFKFSVKVDL